MKEERESRASKNNRLANKESTAITNLSTRASNSFRTRFRFAGWGEKSLTRCTRVATLADACFADFRSLPLTWTTFSLAFFNLSADRSVNLCTLWKSVLLPEKFSEESTWHDVIDCARRILDFRNTYCSEEPMLEISCVYHVLLETRGILAQFRSCYK